MQEEQKDPDPVAQSTSILPITSTVDLSERDNKETLVVKEEETNDAGVFGLITFRRSSRTDGPYLFHNLI